MPSLLAVRSRVNFDLSNFLFVASLLCMFLAEAFLIRGLWYRHLAHRRFDLPLLVWTPAVGEFFLLLNIRRSAKEGHLSPSFAAKLSSGVATVLLVAYLLITRFAQVLMR